MHRLINRSFILLIAILLFTVSVSAAETVRVGLESVFKNITSAGITESEVNVSINGNAVSTLTSGNGFKITPSQKVYVSFGQYSAFNEAFAAMPAVAVPAGKVLSPAYGKSGWTLYFSGFASVNDAGEFTKTYGGTVLNPSGMAIEVSDNGGKVISIFDASFNPVFRNSSGKLTVNGNPYRGGIEFYRTGGSMSVVNVVDIEQYLYGVVPKEMPALWSIEAVKAQAVAARTYAMNKKGVHTSSGYELCDTTHCQVYGGIKNEHENANLAVNQTEGVMCYYDGKPIDAVFYSSSGGYTENSEDVWMSYIPYMRAVEDSYEKEGKVWTYTLTAGDINKCLSYANANIGTVSSITGEYNSNGKLLKLIINGTNGKKDVKGDGIRTFFAPAAGSLMSKMFTINGQGATGNATAKKPLYAVGKDSVVGAVNIDSAWAIGDGSKAQVGQSNPLYAVGNTGVNEIPKQETTASQTSVVNIPVSSNTVITLNGRGWGHGVGLSQYGAKGMAEAGFDYISILKHYYTGIEVY